MQVWRLGGYQAYSNYFSGECINYSKYWAHHCINWAHWAHHCINWEHYCINSPETTLGYYCSINIQYCSHPLQFGAAGMCTHVCDH